MGPLWHHKGAMIPLQGLHRDWQFYLEVKAKVVNRRLNVPIIIIILWLLWLLLLQQTKSNLRMNVTRGTLRCLRLSLPKWSKGNAPLSGARGLKLFAPKFIAVDIFPVFKESCFVKRATSQQPQQRQLRPGTSVVSHKYDVGSPRRAALVE